MPAFYTTLEKSASRNASCRKPQSLLMRNMLILIVRSVGYTRIIESKDTDTEVTGRSTGHPVRVLKNRLTRKFRTLEKENVDPSVLEELGAGALYKAAIEGDMEQGSIMAGQVAGLVTKEQSAEEIILEIMNDASEIYNKTGRNLGLL